MNTNDLIQNVLTYLACFPLIVGFGDEDEEKDKSESKDDDKEEEDSENEEAESEDDSEEEEQEEDSSEDSEEEESEESEEESEVDNEEAENIARIAFTDPKKLDPKLRVAFKKMQAIFTRKLQLMSGVIKKAEAFDKLLTDPRFQKLVSASSKKRSSREEEEDDSDDSSDDDDETPVTRKDLASFMKRLETKFEEREESKVNKERALKEVAIFKKDHPDFKLYIDDMKSLMEEHPTLTLEMAYKLVKEGEEEVDEEEDIRRKKQGNTRKPSSNSGKGEGKKKIETFEDAAALAERILARGKRKLFGR